MKCQTQIVVVVIVILHHQGQGPVASIIVLLSDSGSVIVILHHQRQGHVASILVLLSDSGSGYSHSAPSKTRPCS